MKKILITGGTGLLGNAFSKYDVVRVGSKDYDLRDFRQALAMIKDTNADRVIHLSARVGGVKANSEFVADYFRDNILINTNTLEAARVMNVEKVVSILSTCIYPSVVEYPITEEKLHMGYPDESNFGYAFSKRMLEIQSRAYRKQYGCNFVSVIPNNLYGEFDNFEKVYSHVVPAMIRKFYEAILKNEDVILWGTGQSLREFSYAEDIADIIMEILESYDDEMPLNIGNTDEISIKDLAGKIADKMNFKGKIIWDENMPNGQFRKPSDNSRFRKLYPDFKYTNLDEGLEKTCKWFKEVYPNIRGF